MAAGDQELFMMSNTPRMCVGSTTFQVEVRPRVLLLDAVQTALRGFPGVRVVGVDLAGGVLTVATDDPVDRAELVAALTGTGCTVLA